MECAERAKGKERNNHLMIIISRNSRDGGHPSRDALRDVEVCRFSQLLGILIWIVAMIGEMEAYQSQLQIRWLLTDNTLR